MEKVLLFENLGDENESDFVGLKEKVDKLLPIFKKYKYNDLVKAIFCINSWRNNRSCFESTCALNVTLIDTLNLALIECEKMGNITIDDYKNFTDFFNEIKVILQPTYMDDLTLNDFGEVKIKYKEKEYSVILGTGYEANYSMLEFIPKACEYLKYEGLYENVLKYFSSIIDFLKKTNFKKDNNEILFELPSLDFFDSVQNFFSTQFVPNYNERFVQLLSKNLKKERRHFYVYQEIVYPLFNTSILADFYSIILDEIIDKTKSELVNITLLNILHRNFDPYSKSNKIIYPVSTIENNKFSSPKPYLFLINNITDIILVINGDDFEDIDEEVKRIRNLHSKNNLSFSEVVSREKNGQYLGFKVKNNQKLHIIVCNSTTDITKSFGAALGEQKYHFYTALDIVFFLNNVESFDEWIEYLTFKDEDHAQVMISGLSANHFIMWKENGHMISKGAIEFNLVNIGYGETDQYIYDYFKNRLYDYPFNIKTHLFNNPFSWIINDYEDGFQQFESKFGKSICGYGKNISGNYVFLGHNIMFFKGNDFTNEEKEKIYMLDGLNIKLFNKFGYMLTNIFKNKFIYLLYLPMLYAKKVDHNGFIKKDKEYVYSDYINSDGQIMFRYTCELDKLMKDIEKAKNKEIEIKYFLELLSPLKEIYPSEYEIIEKEILTHIDEKKEVDTFAMKMEYYYSPYSPLFILKDKYFVKAKKELAQICRSNGIKTQNYRKSKAVKVFETVEKDIVKLLDDKLKRYSQDLLTQKILKYLSTSIHVMNVDQARYHKFVDVDDQVLKEVKFKALNEREEYKKCVRLLQYFLEENLYIIRDSSVECGDEEFYQLCAYINWLIILHDNAAICNFSNEEISFTFDGEYIVNIEVPENEEKKYNELQIRYYNSQDYWLRNDKLDKKYLDMCIISFKKDTGFDFLLMIDILHYLSLPQEEEVFFKELEPNVFEIDIKMLLSEFIKVSNGDYKEKEIRKALDFLTIIPDSLKIIEDKNYPSLPIWNREYRNNRIETKPLIKCWNKLIFSTVCCYDLKNRWTNGMIGIYPPFEIGLDNTIKVMKKWKEKYEKLIVQDLFLELKKYKIGLVFKEKMLNKLDPNGRSHPASLGDYDILLFDTNNKIIWNIECKFVQKVGSIFESSMQQKDFFENNQKKKSYAFKFQKRIDYLSDKKNYSRILKSLKIPIEEYNIKSVMVTNKVLAPLGYNIDFKIESYYEFIDTIKNFYNIK